MATTFDNILGKLRKKDTGTGTPGPKGDKGDPGVDGQDGADGQGIDHISFDSTTNPGGDQGVAGFSDTYIIYGDVDENIVLGSFVVKNGEADDEIEVFVLNTNQQFYADGSMGVVDPNGKAGWYFKNSQVSKKINWYFYAPAPSTLEFKSDLSFGYALLQFNSVVSLPFFSLYSKPKGDGNDFANWYRSRWSFSNYSITPLLNTLYLVYFGSTPPASLYPGVPRIQLTLDNISSVGPKLDNEEILTLSMNTNSVALINTVEFNCRNLGYKSLNEHNYTLHAVETASPLTGEFLFTSDVNDVRAGVVAMSDVHILTYPVLDKLKDGCSRRLRWIINNAKTTGNQTIQYQFIVGGQILTLPAFNLSNSSYSNHTIIIDITINYRASNSSNVTVEFTRFSDLGAIQQQSSVRGSGTWNKTISNDIKLRIATLTGASVTNTHNIKQFTSELI